MVFLHIHGIVVITSVQQNPAIKYNQDDLRIPTAFNYSLPVSHQMRKRNISKPTTSTDRRSNDIKQVLLDSVDLKRIRAASGVNVSFYMANKTVHTVNKSAMQQNRSLPVTNKPAKVPKKRPTNDPLLEKKYYMRRPTKVNQYVHRFVMKPEKICDKDTFMMILVHSFHPYTEKRMAIRETWGSVTKGKAWPNKTITDNLKLVFMLGTHKQAGFNDKIRDEMEIYNDIVQGDFIDDYKNMTLKSLLGLKLVMEECPKAKFMLKSDDDMIINLPYLLQILHQRAYNWTMMGPLNRGSRVYRSGKWKLTQEQYPFYTFPEYEAGSAYVFTTDLVKPLYETAEYVPSFHIDDVYITGVLGRILNVTHHVQPGFAYWTDKAPKSCDILHNVKISATKMTPTKMRVLWDQIVKGVCVPESKLIIV